MTKKQSIFSLVAVAFLALLPLLAVDLPRFLAFGPAIAGVLGMGLYYSAFGEKPHFSKPALIVVLCVIAMAALSCLWALDPENSWSRSLKLAGLMVPSAFLPGLAMSIKYEVLKKYLWLIPAGVLSAAALIASELMFGAPLHKIFRIMTGEEIVRDAVFNRGAVTAVICAFPALAILSSCISKKSAFIIFAAIFGAMLILSESQSAQMAVIFGLIFTFFFPYKSRYAWRGLTAIIAALILSAPFISIWAFQHTAAVLNETPGLGFGYGYAGARLEIWDFVSRYALQEPLHGFGIEATRSIENFDTAQIYQDGTSVLHPHNFAIQVWMEFGLIGALAASAFFAYILHMMQKQLTIRENRIALPTFITALSVASAGYGMWQSWWLGLLFLAWALCILAIKTIRTENT